MRYVLLLPAVLLLFSTAAALAAPARVAIMPFEINAEKDLTFLQEGILDMLGSRLAWRDKVEVISENQTKAALAQVEGFEGESRALLVGGKLKADYVLFGSLTVFGESVSIDAKMVDVSGQQEPLPFFAQTSGMGQVIPQINQFATNINATVFGRGVARPPVAAAPAAGAVAATQAQPAPPVQDSRMHPEKLLESGIQGEDPVPVAGQPYQTPNPAFEATIAGAASRSGPTFWKSRSVKALITGIDVADADGDGLVDVVVATDKAVAIYHMQNGRMVKKAEAATAKRSTFISVDVGDVNGNGIPEIYISSLGPTRSSVDSLVVEYARGTYQTLSKGDAWFYRVAKTADQGAVLLGQRQKMGGSSIFSGAIREMTWQGDRLVPGRQLLKGGKTNLMGVAYGDITHTGSSVIAGYSDWDRVRIYGGGSQMIWEEADRSGGDKLFFNLPKIDPGQPNIQFFPLRIRSVDIDRNGKPEVLIARHDELAKSMLKDFRRFKQARLELTEWNGLGLATKWRTQEISGRVSDFAVGDFDNDGMEELVIAVVSKEGSAIFTSSASNVIAFDLNV